VARMTHTSEPVPFILYGGEQSEKPGVAGYDEDSAKASGLFVDEGFRLMELMKNS
jgi:2,3-bisphosphoglycerate-independent phosphoglycerate mutase